MAATHDREGVAGIGGYCKVGHWASNSLHMCPMMPRRWGPHRIARIAHEQGQSPEFAPAAEKCGSTFGQEVGGCDVDCKVGQPLGNSLHTSNWMPRCWGYHRGSWGEREPRVRPEGATPRATWFSSLLRGVVGINADCKMTDGARNSHHILPQMPCSRGDNRTPIIWREPRARQPSPDVRLGGGKSGWHTSSGGCG